MERVQEGLGKDLRRDFSNISNIIILIMMGVAIAGKKKAPDHFH